MEDKAKEVIEKMGQVSFGKIAYDGLRDVETKKAFFAYLRAFPEQRFFQAITNFVREKMDLDCWSLCIVDAPDKTNGLKDVFYIEGDKVLKKKPRTKRKERIDKMDLVGRAGIGTAEKIAYRKGVEDTLDYVGKFLDEDTIQATREFLLEEV